MDRRTFRPGFRPEPPHPKHLSFESGLKPRLAGVTVYRDVDLRPFSPLSQRHDQQTTSSCAANAVVRAVEIRQNMFPGGPPYVDLSRLAVYYLARELMDPPETHKDEGVFISHACDVIRRFGVCPESDWPFDPGLITTPPSWSAMRRAYQHKIKAFYRIESTGARRVAEVARAIQSGLPVVYGTVIDDQWGRYHGKLDVLDPLGLPMAGREWGGHATVLIGTRGDTFIGENSWGTWGDEGFYRIKAEVIASPVSSDFWVLENTDEPWSTVSPPSARRCPKDTDGDGNCHHHPRGCP